MVDTPAGTADQRNAFSVIRQFLIDNGLPESLAAWAWEQLLQDRGPDTISLELTQRPEFVVAFPEIAARKQAGLPPVSAAEIVAYRKQATEIMRAAGLPQQFYDQPQDFTNLISADVSVNELSSRIRDGYLAAQQAPQETRDELSRLYGVGPGDLTAFYLDPTKTLPLIQQRVATAGIAGAAQRTGYGQLDVNQAERLNALGVNERQAQQGFNELANESELFNALPGENADQIDQESQLGATFGGNANAARRIRRRAEQRAAAFGGGGHVSASNQGITGLAPTA